MPPDSHMLEVLWNQNLFVSDPSHGYGDRELSYTDKYQRPAALGQA
jgi:hypothetical protein